VRMPPGADIGQPWGDLAGLAPPPGRNALAAALLAELLPALETFERDGLAAFAARWAASDALAGRAVRILDGGREHDGIALGIDAQGALRVRHADGSERAWHGGEVSVRDATAPDRTGSTTPA
jgi:BirA family biotin operon repressor/biotin-[acetyl-CoA-carboxylase] ligase